MPKKRLTASEQVMIKWEAYPNAPQYRIQIHEKTEAHGFSRYRNIELQKSKLAHTCWRYWFYKVKQY